MYAIQRRRLLKGLSKAEVGRRAKMQGSTISWIETGRFKPYQSQLEKLAKALDWEGNPEELLEEVDNNEQ